MATFLDKRSMSKMLPRFLALVEFCSTNRLVMLVADISVLSSLAISLKEPSEVMVSSNARFLFYQKVFFSLVLKLS